MTTKDDSGSDNNVVDISEQRKKRGRPKKEEGPQVSEQDRFRAWRYLMNNDQKKPLDWKDFPYKFHYIRDSSGVPALFEENVKDRTVRAVTQAYIEDCMLAYSADCLVGDPCYQISPRNVSAHFRMWLSKAAPLAEPPLAIAQASTKELAFTRLPFDLPRWAAWDPSCVAKAPPCPPKFQDFIARCGKGGETVKAFIGSILDPKADVQQYLVLKGAGGDGKGAFTRFLKRLLGTACVSLQPPSDNFWMAHLYEKRVGYFPDMGDSTFFTSPKFKAITGQDGVTINRKGSPAFDATLSIKLILCTNAEPEVTGIQADIRRMLYVAVDPVKGKLDSRYEDELWAERDAIINHCWWEYLRLCGRPDGTCGQIPPTEKTEEVSTAGDERARVAFENYFKVSSPGIHTEPSTVHWALAKAGVRSNKAIGQYKEIWERLFHIKVRHIGPGDLGYVHPGYDKNGKPKIAPIKYFGMETLAGVRELELSERGKPPGSNF